MFDIGWSELVLIGVVALIAIGPKELPGAMRTLGQWVTKIRRMASEFQGQFQEAMREAELAELRKEVDEMAAKASEYTHFDPVEDIRKDLETAADLPDLDAPVAREPVAHEAAPALPDHTAEAGLPPAEPVATPETEPAAAAVASAEPAEGASKPDAKPDAGKAA
jgi:sec-independent protein translocase protein TatB